MTNRLKIVIIIGTLMLTGCAAIKKQEYKECTPEQLQLLLSLSPDQVLRIPDRCLVHAPNTSDYIYFIP